MAHSAHSTLGSDDDGALLGESMLLAIREGDLNKTKEMIAAGADKNYSNDMVSRSLVLFNMRNGHSCRAGLRLVDRLSPWIRQPSRVPTLY
jgi:hypothetical protein